ncbi:antibiotic biosynthesis monooxygenase [Salana multivorans]|uniref:Antibiotic biosynthesis monooxygenase n=1 Tax=Salana multivorans TaxID=120377 RepID=A0A3N2D0Y5_9MICO|nr:antibiotic biosynthesis monooxygenase [Salana multivorans]ROR93318.1 antibiotic biosynthesis monooxygenase [Salana multivorans]
MSSHVTSGPVTFLNVIDVDPSRQREVIELLAEGVERVMTGRPGFLSATILASADGGRVVNVARWRTAEDVRATQADPAAAAYARRTAAIGSASPGLYLPVGEFTATLRP